MKISVDAVDHKSYRVAMKRTILSLLFLATVALFNPSAGTEAVDSNTVGNASTRELIIDEAIALGNKARKTEDKAMYERVLVLLAQVDTPDNTNSCVPFWQGVALNRLNRFAEAIEKYRLADKLSPNDSMILNDWGTAARKLGELQGALALFERAIKCDPNNSWPYGGAGVVLKEMGRQEDAQRYLRLAIALDPEDSVPRQHLADSLAKLGRHEEALECLRVAVQLSPSNAWSHWQIGRSTMVLGNCAESIEGFQKAIDLTPKNPNYRFWLAQALQCSGRHQEAIEQAKAGLQLDPNDSDGWAYWGVSLGGIGCYCEAVAKLSKAVSLGLKRDDDLQMLREARKLCWGHRFAYTLMAGSILLIVIQVGRRFRRSRQAHPKA